MARLQAGNGFDEFIKQDLLPAVKADHSWVSFSHQKVSNIKVSEFCAMQQHMSSFMRTCDKLERMLHADVWPAIAARVHEARLRQSTVVGFENLDSWADPLASVSALQAQTEATCWKFGLGGLPAWFVFANCFAAVAVSKYLDMACFRCGVHLIAIPLRHLFWPPVTRGKPNQQHVQPKEPRFVNPMEEVR